MITQKEQKFLQSIPESKKVSVKPFDPRAKEIGELIVSRIKKLFPNLKILFMGATALEIAGQNDIDIYLLSKPREFNKYLPTLKNAFGEPTTIHNTFIEWGFMEEGYSVELYLTKPPQRQVKVFKILKTDSQLLKDYEDLKLSLNGKSYREYQKAKYEFYNKIL